MRKIIVSFFLTAGVLSAFAQQEIFSKSGEAINGYDPVAYFNENKPIKGKKEYSLEWKGANWLFSTDQNKKDFMANPEKFAPQYGGFCAYGTGDGTGHKAPTSPEAWTIVDGKLYLNYNKDVQALWKKEQKKYILQADKNWPTVKLERD